MPVSVRSGCRRFCCPVRQRYVGYFFLYHSGTARDDVLVFQHLEKYLAGDVVRVITGQYERLSVEQPVKVHFQKVTLDNVILQWRIGFTEIGNRFVVYFNDFYQPVFFYQKLGQYSHTRSYLQYRQLGKVSTVSAISCATFKSFRKCCPRNFLGFTNFIYQLNNYFCSRQR